MANRVREAPPLHLVWDNPSTGEHYERIGTPPITIGRAASLNIIVLNSKRVSRQHARLESKANQLFIIDQASTNGTLINNKPIKCTRLSSGDRFEIRPFIFTIIAKP